MFRFSQKIEISEGTNIILIIILINTSIWTGNFITLGFAYTSVVVEFTLAILLAICLAIIRYMIVASRLPLDVYISTLASLIVGELVFLGSYVIVQLVNNPAYLRDYVQLTSLVIINYALYLLHSADALQLKTELIAPSHLRVTERSRYVINFSRRIFISQPDVIYRLAVCKMTFRYLRGKIPDFLSLEQIINQSPNTRYNLFLVVNPQDNIGITTFPELDIPQLMQILLFSSTKRELIEFLEKFSSIQSIQITL